VFVVGLVLGVWFWFSSIPFHSISVRSGGVFVLAGAVGKAKISGVFLDVAMLVGAVFFAGGVLSFVRSLFLLLLLSRGSILFGRSVRLRFN
jgi:Ca2+/Na+ antiporter